MLRNDISKEDIKVFTLHFSSAVSMICEQLTKSQWDNVMHYVGCADGWAVSFLANP